MTDAWLDVRRQLQTNRHAWGTDAAADYPAERWVAGTPLLAPASWFPVQPIPLGAIRLEYDAAAVFNGVTGEGSNAVPSSYSSYADAIAALARPAVFENRPTYRLLSADLTAPDPVLRLGRGTYFDSINTGEASAHEYAARRLGMQSSTPLRDAIGHPWEPARRPTNLAISTLVIRKDTTSTFLMHWRDPTKVGHAGGLYQVVPSGIFQPSADATWNELHDFNLWHNLTRELAEELLGTSEDHGSNNAPINYDTWPFATTLTAALTNGTAHAYCVGLGVDPLTFATDLLTILIIDATTYDALFPTTITHNTEGRVLTPQPFTPAVLKDFIHHKPLQPAGAAILQLAWDNNLA
ncbi:hypothetical protein AB0L70_13770 [Kribbella sp. NPDC051952]|uniref:hypothetical protein n=1 Tax=Kribbella sp. NPDC051952 TaxID=3154851 RepID=UPI003417E502